MKSGNKFAVFLAVLVILLVALGAATWILLRDSGETATGNNGLGVDGPRAPRTLPEVPQARFVSVFASNAAGGLSSYMVGGKTDEFNAFADAIAQARPLEGTSDETFTDLLVFSFAANDTLEVSYSRARNQFILEDVLYQPTANLGPMIAAVEQKFGGH